jgi:hypothetical protein
MTGYINEEYQEKGYHWFVLTVLVDVKYIYFPNKYWSTFGFPDAG